MKVKFFFVVSFLLISVALSGMQTSVSNHKGEVSFRGTGGPDDYGYEWIDSDEPSGPTYSWIDITGIGTEVTGLTDDNNVGPFLMGFDFPYYWYKVNQFWVNANGAISFSDENVYVPQGISGFFIPHTNTPNDLLIPLGADLTFENGYPAECYYYTNNIDTLIVSFLRVPAWVSGPPSGEHTFQIILTAQDSCIYFQYGDQIGTFYNSACCGGIENIIGNVGLQVFFNINPLNLIDYAVKFTPPDSTTYEALDIGIDYALTPGNKGVFIFPGEPFPITANIRNYGTLEATNFSVSCLLWDTTYTSYFTDTITVTSLAAGEDTLITFSPAWTPPAVNDYLAFLQTILAGDINPTNNSIDVELEVITLPGWMMYDSDPASAVGYAWIGAGGGWGQEFEPPQYPVDIDSVSLAMSSTNNCNVPILLMDDDGANGFPGTILYADTIPVYTGAGFNHYIVPISGVTITSGKFYVGMVQVGDSFPRIMMEDASPFSRRGWELTGSWSPSRERDNFEILIRSYSSTPQGINEEEHGKTYVLSLLPAHPNPVKTNTTLFYALPTNSDISLKVYNLLGQEVRTLVNGNKKAGVHSVQFNAQDSRGNTLPQGIYFYRLTVGDRSLTRKITLLR